MQSDVLYGDIAAPGHLKTMSPSVAFRLFGLTGIALRAVNVKAGDFLFLSTTVAVILLTLTSKNGSVVHTLSC